MILDRSNSRLALRLAASSAVPTVQPEFVARYTGELGGKLNYGKMNGTVAVTAVQGPDSGGAHRIVYDMTVYNPDASALDVEVVLEVAGVVFRIWAGTLDQGDTLQYHDGGQGGRFTVTDSSGSLKVVDASSKLGFTLLTLSGDQSGSPIGTGTDVGFDTQEGDTLALASSAWTLTPGTWVMRALCRLEMGSAASGQIIRFHDGTSYIGKGANPVAVTSANHYTSQPAAIARVQIAGNNNYSLRFESGALTTLVESDHSFCEIWKVA